MNAENNSQDQPALPVRDYVDPVGRFFVLNKKGRLFALKQLGISDDCSRVVPRIATADFGIVYPLIGRIRASKIVLVLHCGRKPRSYFLTNLKIAGATKRIKIFDGPEQIVSRALDDALYPLLIYDEIEEGVAMSHRNRSPLAVPVRYMELKSDVPRAWVERLQNLFMLYANLEPNRLNELEGKLTALRAEIKQTMLQDYFMKCVWLDTRSGAVGRLVQNGEGVEVQPFDIGDSQVRAFLCALEKDTEERFCASYVEVGTVLPELTRNQPWVSPTLHLHNNEFRNRHDLKEYYSLYKGFSEISHHGTPVLLYKGDDPLTHPTAVRYLQLADRSSRLLGGDILRVSVQEFTGRDLVWREEEL